MQNYRGSLNDLNEVVYHIESFKVPRAQLIKQ